MDLGEIEGKMIRLHNRRVILFRRTDHEGVHWQMQFRKLGEKNKGEDRVVKTVVNLSDEAMGAIAKLYRSLSHEKMFRISIWEQLG